MRRKKNAYQLLIEKKNNLANIRNALKQENLLNLEMLKEVEYERLHEPDQIDKLTQLIQKETPLDSLNQYATSVLNVQYINLNDSYLIYYLENVDNTHQDQLVGELIKLQNLFSDLTFMWDETIIPYRMKLLSEDLIDYVDLGQYEFLENHQLNTHPLLNRLWLLQAMEVENRRVFLKTYQQVQLIDSLLQAEDQP